MTIIITRCDNGFIIEACGKVFIEPTILEVNTRLSVLVTNEYMGKQTPIKAVDK